MNTSDSNVKRIGLCSGWNGTALNQLGRKRPHLRVYRQPRKAL